MHYGVLGVLVLVCCFLQVIILFVWLTFRFVVGPYEEKDYASRSSQGSNTFYRQEIQNEPNASGSNRSNSWQRSRNKNVVFHLVNQALRAYKKIINSVKCCSRHNSCPHPFSCIYYTIQVTLIILKQVSTKREILIKNLNIHRILGLCISEYKFQNLFIFQIIYLFVVSGNQQAIFYRSRNPISVKTSAQFKADSTIAQKPEQDHL